MSAEVPFEVVPLATSKVIRNSILPGIHYTNQDYWSLLGKMTELVKHHYSKNFNEFIEPSLGMMLIELWAFLGDQLSFKIDQIANEVFIDTVTELANAMRLASLVGFTPTPPLPARALFSATLTHPVTFDLPLQTPIILEFMGADGSGERTMELFAADHNNNPLFGEPIVILAGHTTTTSIVGVEGKTHHHQVTSNGEAYQRTSVPGKNVLWRSVKLSIDGVPWREVSFFSDSQPRPEFRVEHDSKYQSYIFFGNNSSGLIPPKGSVIHIAYRTGGGVAGNIITGGIAQNISIHSNELGHMITAFVQNYTRGEGGYDGDSIEDIRVKLPLYLKTQNRCVTGADYKSLVDIFTSPTNGLVGKSVAVLRTHGCAGNIIDIYVLARDGEIGLTKASNNLRDELSQELIKKKMLTDYLCIRDGEVVHVDVHIEAVLDKLHRSYEGNIRERAERKINQFFALGNWEYGQPLKDNDIVKSLADIREIQHLDVNFTTTKSLEQGHGTVTIVTTRFNEIIRPDNIMLNFSYK